MFRRGYAGREGKAAPQQYFAYREYGKSFSRGFFKSCRPQALHNISESCAGCQMADIPDQLHAEPRMGIFASAHKKDTSVESDFCTPTLLVGRETFHDAAPCPWGLMLYSKRHMSPCQDPCCFAGLAANMQSTHTLVPSKATPCCTRSCLRIAFTHSHE